MKCSYAKSFWFLSLLFFTYLEAGDFVSLPKSMAKAVLGQCSRSSPEFEGSWELKESDIEDLEANLFKLKKIEATGCCRGGKLELDPSRYFRQYAGIVIKGKKFIYINALPEKWDHKKKVPQMVCDGGKSFWGAVYDPVKKEFSNLSFNGEA